MKDWQSLAHTKWECKYHLVIVPKYRKKVLYGKLRKRIGEILRELCRYKGIEILEAHAMWITYICVYRYRRSTA